MIRFYLWKIKRRRGLNKTILSSLDFKIGTLGWCRPMEYNGCSGLGIAWTLVIGNFIVYKYRKKK